MSALPPDQIQNEIVFTQLLLENLDPGSDTYEDDKALYEARLGELLDRLNAPQPYTRLPQSCQNGEWVDQYNGLSNHGVLLDNGLNQTTSSASTNHSGYPTQTESSTSSVRGSASGSTLSSPLAPYPGTRKRSRTFTANHAGTEHSERKRFSANASPSVTSPSTPSSLDSLEEAERSFEQQHSNGTLFLRRGSDIAGQRALDGQRAGRRAMQDQQTAQHQAVPQTVQQTPSFGFPAPPQRQLPTRPHVPQPSSPSAFPYAAYSNNALSFTNLSPSHPSSGYFHTDSTAPNYGLTFTNQNIGLAPTIYQTGGNRNPQFGSSGYQGSLGENPAPPPPPPFPPLPPPENYIDLTEDSPAYPNGICQEISRNATQWNPPLADLPQTLHVNNIPGSFPIDPFDELDLAYTAQQTNNGPTYGQYAPITGFSRDNGPQSIGNAYQAGQGQSSNMQNFDFDAMFDDTINDEQLTALLNMPNSISTSSFTLGPLPSLSAPTDYPVSYNTGNISSQINKLEQLRDQSEPARTPEELKKLLENIRPDEDIPPEQREETPKGMNTRLMEHQKLGLTWLKKMEEGSNKGGVLADDMGLGKTVQALALILDRPSEDPMRKTTLIIAPVALMRQWEREIQSKVKDRYALSVHVYHGNGKKHDFNKLRTYDVVLTTFGTLGQEMKKKREWGVALAANPGRVPTKREKLALLGDECKWYRIIIDEAQCIKNKATLNAQAACELQSLYRFCMTGTPMMNTIDDLYSLIHFLRIRPYNDQQQFNVHFGRPLKSSNRGENTAAMKKLQVLLKAILLRRTKDSLIDGRPIITIPPKHVEKQHVIFSEDEETLYRGLETKSQITFNRYLRQGTVGRNYGNVLVLLLRLRQACCHPHLINDLSVDAATQDLSEDAMMALASQLSEDVVARLKEQEGFECPICYDGVENPTIFIPCGHNTCGECFAKITDPSRAIAAGDESSTPKCPQCREKVEPKKVTNYKHFKKVHMPEKLSDEERKEMEAVSDDGSDTDDYDSEDSEEDETLNGFIVPDELSDSDGFEPAQDVKPKIKKSKRKGKGKEKAPKKTLAQLKKESLRNRAAKTHYLRRLQRNWQTSAKIEKTMQILHEIQENDPTEKTIIFSQFTSLLDLLEVPLSNEKWSYERYDGSMKANDRADAVSDFMEKAECKVMLISLKAGNAGLNLNKASQVIILDPFWNPFVEDQAIDRAHRIMQQRRVYVHRILIENTVEDRIIALQEKKRELISTALDENAGRSISRLGERELAYLFGVRSSF